jgi:glycosyltransferase involved in cell wall biosynthesis
MDDNLRVAIVTDWMLKPGGADRLLISMLKVIPNADIYTSIYFKDNYSGDFNIINNVYPSFLQKFPFKKKLARHYNLLTPIAFENFNLEKYDIVLSLSAGPAKGIISGFNNKHISIILTPPRYLWDKDSNFRASRLRFLYQFVTPFVSTYLRVWDKSTVLRSDKTISISKYIKSKVQKYYRIDSDLLYPGIGEFWFSKQPNQSGGYFLCVSRLYDYKRIDWAIKSAIEANRRLLIVGTGPDEKFLKKLVSKKDNIEFLGNISDIELKDLYSKADALIFPGVEDYGYVPLEAMASGTPVLGLNEGGVFETVEEGLTGEFFSTIEELTELLRNFDKSKYNHDNIVEYTRRFSEERFHDNLRQIMQEII